MTDDRERIRAHMRVSANQTRALANEMAAMYGGVDDPMYPHDSAMSNDINDWQDFVDKVARPIVESEGDDYDRAVQAAMHLFRTVSPYYLCAAMVMMDNRIKRDPERTHDGVRLDKAIHPRSGQ